MTVWCVPVGCSEEELRAAQAPAEAEKPPAAAPQSAEATQKAIKALIKSIPSDRAGVFAYPINWNAYDTGRSAMAGKILAWVKKKVCSCFLSFVPGSSLFTIFPLEGGFAASA